MYALSDQQILEAVVEVLANEPEGLSLAEHLRMLRRAHPDAAWDVILTDVQELPDEACADNVDRWYATALIALKTHGVRVLTLGQSTGSSRLAATWGAVSQALIAVIEAEVEEESDFPRDAEGLAIY